MGVVYPVPLNVVQGDSFQIALSIAVDVAPGVVVDFSAWQVTAAASTRFDLVFPMTVTWIDHAAGLYELSVSTKRWPLGTMHFDICYVTDSGQVTTTNQIELLVTKRSTPLPGSAP